MPSIDALFGGFASLSVLASLVFLVRATAATWLCFVDTFKHSQACIALPRVDCMCIVVAVAVLLLAWPCLPSSVLLISLSI